MKRCAMLLIAALSAAQTPTLEQYIDTRVTAAALKADVSFLASDALQGRGTPSPGLEVAGEYIASEFRRAGLEPAGGDGYFQNAPYHLVTPNTEGFQLTLTTGGKEIRAEADAAYFNRPAAADVRNANVLRTTLSALESLRPEAVQGKVLFVDSPISLASAHLLTAAAIRLQPALILLLPASGRPWPSMPSMFEDIGKPVPIVAVWNEEMRKELAGNAGDLD